MKFDYKLYRPKKILKDMYTSASSYYKSPDVHASPLSKIGDLADRSTLQRISRRRSPVFGKNFSRSRLAFGRHAATDEQLGGMPETKVVLERKPAHELRGVTPMEVAAEKATHPHIRPSVSSLHVRKKNIGSRMRHKLRQTQIIPKKYTLHQGLYNNLTGTRRLLIKYALPTLVLFALGSVGVGLHVKDTASVKSSSQQKPGDSSNSNDAGSVSDKPKKKAKPAARPTPATASQTPAAAPSTSNSTGTSTDATGYSTSAAGSDTLTPSDAETTPAAPTSQTTAPAPTTQPQQTPPVSPQPVDSATGQTSAPAANTPPATPVPTTNPTAGTTPTQPTPITPTMPFQSAP